jgi:hypothetical protein
VIDERKSLDERIRTIRGFYIDEIRQAKSIEIESSVAFQECKSAASLCSKASSDLARKRKERKTQEELKGKLQEMCRLVQKQTKDLVEDNETQRELEKKRMDDLTISFTETIGDISSKISEQEELFKTQLADNDQLRERLLEFQTHSNLRNEHLKSQLHAKDLEYQLVEARRAQEVSKKQLSLFSIRIRFYRLIC